MGLIAQLQREIARQQRASRQAQAAYVRAQNAARREAERTMRALERAAAWDERERKRLYIEARTAEVAAQNADLTARIEDLQGILASTLAVDDHINLASLRKKFTPPPYEPGWLAQPIPPPGWERFAPQQPSGFGKVFSQGRYQQQVSEAQRHFAQAQAQHAAAEQERLAKLAKYQDEHRQWSQHLEAKISAENAELAKFAQDFASGAPEAVVEYFGMVLGNSVYPEDFPQSYRLAYVPESKQLVIEYDLPPIAVVPSVRDYRYIKVRDEMTTMARPAKEIRERYTSVVTQVTLRTLHEIFEADRTSAIETVVFNGMVDSVNLATGQAVRPCLVTVRTTREAFGSLNLARVEPSVCLQHLNASVSKKPEELAPVRPVLEFDMVDKRFIDEVDVLADLDKRPNLLLLKPTEFESLIQNLFAKMGLDTKQTRPSRDGGVDCVAFDPRPIFGGKVVIQAKRYKNTVDVSAVRDLFGTLQNEGASKGILVTTSGYGPASYEFASGKPMELIDGSNLLYLLAEHAGQHARIDATELE